MKKSEKRVEPKDTEPEQRKSKPASVDDALISEFCHLIAKIAMRIATDKAKNPRINKNDKTSFRKETEEPKLIGFYDAARIPEVSKSEVYKILSEIQKANPENELLIPVSSLKALLDEGKNNKKPD
jgi:hypothetical protein